MSRLRIAVLGTMGADPFAGMAWMHLQLAGGLLRLGHDVRYVETTSAWPYDPAPGRARRRSGLHAGLPGAHHRAVRHGRALGLAPQLGRWRLVRAGRRRRGGVAGLDRPCVQRRRRDRSSARTASAAAGWCYFGTDPVLDGTALRRRRRASHGATSTRTGHGDLRREHRHAAQPAAAAAAPGRAHAPAGADGPVGRGPAHARSVHHRGQLAAGRQGRGLPGRGRCAGASTTNS